MNIKRKTKKGSAIILAIVLTSLLAIIGVLFLISSRVDSIATSSIADNKDLTLAVDTVIAKISEDLAEDITKGAIDPNCYADYPDPCNFWLACLEPYKDFFGDYRWRRVSDIYGGLDANDRLAGIVNDYQQTIFAGEAADADGDGVSDSNWIQVPAKYSSKGKLIYAAVRIIDNSAMLNVNTGLIFDSGSSIGLSQKDINVAALSQRGANGIPIIAATKLDDWRRGIEPSYLYEPNVIWQYGNPKGAFTPFDISDELVLRNRYILNSDKMTTRIENLWTYAFKGGLEDPRTDVTKFQTQPDYWFARVNNVSADPCIYDYQHIATTYNCDRIITPASDKMVNINTEPNAYRIRDAIRDGLTEASFPGDMNVAAQIAANVVDYRDDDNNITVVSDYVSTPHFGFERPCIYISEIAANFTRDSSDKLHRSYAIELYNPYYGIDTITPAEWRIQIGIYASITLNWQGNSKYHIIKMIDPTNPSSLNINLAEATEDSKSISFSANDKIQLWRDVNSYVLTVDEVVVPAGFTDPISGDTTPHIYSIQRDITLHKCIRRLWHTAADSNLGNFKTFDLSTDIIQAHPANKPFTNVGEIGQLFYALTYGYGGVEPNFYTSVTEPELRINLADPNYQQIFKYLTVMDPCNHGATGANESRIKGRININTAPWFVIAQLPWVSAHTPNYDLARAIVDKREMRGGYRSIGELMADANGSTDNIGYYGSQSFATISSISPVLMTPNDPNDFPNEDTFEKRDLIFDRISNLVTVRSDVFTAYILVRIGPNGPQKRVIAILDRSEVPAKPVKVIAIQSVPDPR